MEKPTKKGIKKAMKLAEREIKEWSEFLYSCHERLKTMGKKK